MSRRNRNTDELESAIARDFSEVTGSPTIITGIGMIGTPIFTNVDRTIADASFRESILQNLPIVDRNLPHNLQGLFSIDTDHDGVKYIISREGQRVAIDITPESASNYLPGNGSLRINVDAIPPMEVTGTSGEIYMNTPNGLRYVTPPNSSTNNTSLRFNPENIIATEALLTNSSNESYTITPTGTRYDTHIIGEQEAVLNPNFLKCTTYKINWDNVYTIEDVIAILRKSINHLQLFIEEGKEAGYMDLISQGLIKKIE